MNYSHDMKGRFMEEREIDLSDILTSLRKRWKVLVLSTVLGIIISLIVTFLIVTPRYTASTKLFIGKENSESVKGNNLYNNNDIQMYQKILQTYADIIQTRTLVTSSLEKNDIDMNSMDVLKNLKVIPKDNTQIIEVTYVDEDRYRAKEVLESISSEFVNYSNSLISNANIQIVEDIYLPEKPSSPNNILNVTIGFFSGVILGLVLSLSLEYIDNTFSDKKNLENSIGITVIGDIPSFDMFK
mgnify:FL=1